MDDVLDLTIDGAIATITLNRPQAGNSLDLALARGLLQAAIRCDTDAAIRCVVLTGAGKLFCAGGDIGAFETARDTMPALLSELAGTMHMAVTRFMRMRKPLLVLVNGPAAGAGLSLAIAGDIVIAARTAHFTAAYGAIGLSPDGGMSWLLPRLVGLRNAQEMIIANRRVSADEAEAIGLVTRTVDPADLAAEGARQAAILAEAATGAIGSARALLLESFSGPLEGQLEREVRSISAMGGTDDAREGVDAYFARRKAKFSGS
jgi:2-(1,2-epoxy-1,2-dihydrophenyl)acetyl-CoA isomerase